MRTRVDLRNNSTVLFSANNGFGIPYACTLCFIIVTSCFRNNGTKRNAFTINFNVYYNITRCVRESRTIFNLKFLFLLSRSFVAEGWRLTWTKYTSVTLKLNVETSRLASASKMDIINFIVVAFIFLNGSISVKCEWSQTIFFNSYYTNNIVIIALIDFYIIL